MSEQDIPEINEQDRALLEEVDAIVADRGTDGNEPGSIAAFSATLASTMPEAPEAFRSQLLARLTTGLKEPVQAAQPAVETEAHPEPQLETQNWTIPGRLLERFKPVFAPLETRRVGRVASVALGLAGAALMLALFVGMGAMIKLRTDFAQANRTATAAALSQASGTPVFSGSDMPLAVATVPPAGGVATSMPVATVPQSVPQPVGTFLYPTPGLTPTWPVPTVTPTHIMLVPARLVTPSSVSTITLGLDLEVSVRGAISSTEPVRSVMWSPFGDGLLYVTRSGKLYWSDLRGANSTLLHDYSGESFEWEMLGDQVPLGVTIYLTHLGQATNGGPLPGHMDRVRFVPGGLPVFEELPHLPLLWDVRWWRPDRASGVLLVSYIQGGYLGGDRLITLDADGRIVDDRPVPYMDSAAVQPGGEWLAYDTGQQATNVSLSNTLPTTAYLLNLQTGERLQVSPAREGSTRNWSPDGRWFIMGRSILSADGARRIDRVEDWKWLGDAVWSPDSTRLAYSFRGGGCDDPHPGPCPPYVSDIYVVDLPAGKMVDITEAPPINSLGLLHQPKWSPDGKMLAAMIWDSACQVWPCTTNQAAESAHPRPAIYLISASDPNQP